jgi:hypothetical protein
MRVPLPAAMITMSNAMKVPVSNRWKVWIIVMLTPLLLGGCSALRLSYGQGPLLAYWWLDRQVDFSTEQTPRVREALADWFAWHRSTQLPDYAQGLGEVAAAAAGPFTPQQVCAQIDAWQQRAERAQGRAGLAGPGPCQQRACDARSPEGQGGPQSGGCTREGHGGWTANGAITPVHSGSDNPVRR